MIQAIDFGTFEPIVGLIYQLIACLNTF